MNIGELKQAVKDWLDRDDLDEYVDHFVTMGCQRVYRSARTPVNEVLLAGSAVNGTIEIPQRFAALRWLNVGDRTLTPAPGNEVVNPPVGEPTKYGRVGDQIYLSPRSTVDFTMSYFVFEDFASDSDEPALLQVAFDAFLHAALVQAAPFLQDDSRLAVWETLYQSAMNTLKASADDADLGDIMAMRGAF